MPVLMIVVMIAIRTVGMILRGGDFLIISGDDAFS
jgi:hypothetical protein